MTEKGYEANKFNGGANERSETFPTSGPVRAKIATKSGDIRVQAGESNELQVTLNPTSSKYDYLLEVVEVKFDAERNLLEVRTKSRDYSGSSRDKDGKRKKSWFDFGNADLDVVVNLPQGSSLEIKTISGEVSLRGPFDGVVVSSVSGDVDVIDSCGSLDVRTASGDIGTGPVRDTCNCRTASGDVECLSAATTTEISSASGDVKLSVDRPGQLTVKVVSGDVAVAVARGLAVDINGTTVSGNLSSNIDLDASGDAAREADEISIKVTTLSGDIKINKAN